MIATGRITAALDLGFFEFIVQIEERLLFFIKLDTHDNKIALTVFSEKYGFLFFMAYFGNRIEFISYIRDRFDYRHTNLLIIEELLKSALPEWPKAVSRGAFCRLIRGEGHRMYKDG
jgi:hypothetical protein